MANASVSFETAMGDVRRGMGASAEDLAIAALVMAPFAVTVGIWVGWLIWAPSWALVVLTLVVQAVATIWNAGWRARTAQ